MVTATRPVYRIMFPGLLLGILALLVMIILGDASLVGSHFANFQWQYFVLALAFDVVNHVLRFAKHCFHLSHSDIKRLSFWRKLKLFLSAGALSTTPLRVSESYKSVWLSQASGIPLNAADSLHLLDRISDILSVLVLAAAGTMAFPSFWLFFLIIFVLFLGSTLSVQIKSTGFRTNKSGGLATNVKDLSHQLRKCVENNPNAFSLLYMTVALLLGVLSWLAQGASLLFILVGFGLEPNMTLVAIACLVLSFSMLMGLISKLPGGLGVIELAMAALLTLLLDFRPELAVATTILFRLATFWIDLLFGILFWSVTAKPHGLNQEAGRIVQS